MENIEYSLDAEDPRVELEAGDSEVVGNVDFVEAPPNAREGLERQRGHDLDCPWPARPYSLALLGPALAVWRALVAILPLDLCVLFPALYAVQLECAEEANAQGYRDGLPLDLGLVERRVEPGPERLFAVEVLLVTCCAGRREGA